MFIPYRSLTDPGTDLIYALSGHGPPRPENTKQSLELIRCNLQKRVISIVAFESQA